MTGPTCRRCGTTAEGEDDTVPVAWSTSVDAGRVDLLCAACTREHVRDIEAKLDETWW